MRDWPDVSVGTVAPPTQSVAVVLATQGRAALLRKCLTALVEQTRPADQVVVVVVGADPKAEAVIADFSSYLPLVSMAAPTGSGPAVARNIGWRKTTAAFIAFTDDDCRPDSRWLESLLAACGKRTVVVGQVVVDPEDQPPGSMFDRTFQAGPGDAARFSTADILYSRSTLEWLGGFDEAYSFFGEDTDLGRRAMGSGASMVYAGNAVVFHAVHRLGALAALRVRWRAGSLVRLVARHPEVRKELFQGVFWSRSHRQVALALLMLPLTLLTPMALLSPAPWIRDAVYRIDYELGPQSGRGPQLPLRLVQLFLLDVVELLACAWGSLRHRTIFL